MHNMITNENETEMTAAEMVRENERRKEAERKMDYDPLKGDENAWKGRVAVKRDGQTVYVPVSMTLEKGFNEFMSGEKWEVMRCRHDFEYWAARCVTITDKVTKMDVPFVLNRPQRRLAAALEAQRLEGRPIRLVMLKARQWGGSTLVQMYMAWIQLMHKRNWHSLICSHLKDVSANIRGMYTKMLEKYPQECLPDGEKLKWKGCEGMANTRVVWPRGCRVTVCSSENQEAVRGMDCSMAHLTEVAFWREADRHDPVDVARAVMSGIAKVPLSVVVMESTANGVGNYFHREWERAVSGESDKRSFFVPWYEIEAYRSEVTDAEALASSLSEYELELWEQGCTLEAIQWYREKRREYGEERAMMAEFPSTPEEAFSTTDTAVFSPLDVKALKEEGVTGAVALRGEVVSGRGCMPQDIWAPEFVKDHKGLTKVWARPRSGAQYVVSVDVGGRWRGADYSVISVLDRHADRPGDRRPEVVAQWRGHIDHDLLGWKAATMAVWYNTALLVVESNTLESGSEGQGAYILGMLSEVYPNMFHRRGEGGRSMAGFHTNVKTKGMLIANLIALVRDRGYIERDMEACNELLQYECRGAMVYGAKKGCHDDIVMSRALALWAHVHGPEGGDAVTAGDRMALLRQRRF